MVKKLWSILLKNNNLVLLWGFIFLTNIILFFYPHNIKSEVYFFNLVFSFINIFSNFIFFIRKVNIKVYYFKKVFYIGIGLVLFLGFLLSYMNHFNNMLIKVILFYNIFSIFLCTLIYNDYYNLKISDWYRNTISLFSDKSWINITVNPNSNDFTFLIMNGYLFNNQGLHYGNTIITIKDLLNYQEENGLTFNQLTPYDFNVLEMIKI